MRGYEKPPARGFRSCRWLPQQARIRLTDMRPSSVNRLLALMLPGILLGLSCVGPGHAEPSSSLAEPSGASAPVASQNEPSAMPSEGSILKVEVLEPVPGMSPELFAEWGKLVSQRFLGDPSAEQIVELDSRLAAVSVVDATPVFINALDCLDMADPGDIVRAGAISKCWYDGQVHYKRVVLNADPEALRPVDVRNRMLVVDGWIRMWKRTLEQENGVAIFRSRVQQLLVDRAAAREKQWRDFEEKLRQRAEKKAHAEAEAAAEGEPY